jgi:hypothetical protein
MRKISEVVAILMILTVLCGTLPAFAFLVPTKSFPANSMWVEPDVLFDTSTKNVGDRFNVTLFANITTTVSSGGTGAIGGWQFKLRYNNAQIMATQRAWYANKTKPGSDLLWDVPTKTVTATYTANSVSWGESWAGDPIVGPFANVSRMGALATIEFNITASPPKGGKLQSILNISEGMLDGSKDTSIIDYETYDNLVDPSIISGATVNDATYEYDWKQPGATNVDVTPASRLFDSFTDWLHPETTFTETITLRGLSAAWFIINGSMNLHYDHTPNILGVRNVAFTSDWDVSTNFDNSTYGVLYLEALTSKDLSGDVVFATVTFGIIYQGVYPETNTVPLTLSDVALWADPLQITLGTITGASITVNGLIKAPLPWLEIKPHTTVLGPEPVVGTTFSVDVWIMNLTSFWKLVGLQYRINYDPAILDVISVDEGPYIPSFPQFPPPPPYTWFASFVLPDGFGPNILVGELLLPNGTGEWPGPFPGAAAPNTENGLIATITFQVLQQDVDFPPTNITTYLNFIKDEILLIDVNGNPIATKDPVNATVIIIGTPEIGRNIDEYGGADNQGLWAGYPNPFPAPYGGQGPNVPMDLVMDQSEVTFYAYVTYNFWPVQSKDVGFELEGPFVKNESDPTQLIPKDTYQIWFKLTARTDSNGIARITVRMPWPCVDPESITGIYLETSTVCLADQVLTDTIRFYYEHMVYITKVTATPFYVYHDEEIHVCVEYETHAMQTYPALFSVVAQDELGVPFGMALYGTNIGGAQFCTWTTGKFCVNIYVPKWAYSGWATIHVSAYNKDPTIGGFSYGEEYSPAPQVYILPTVPPTVYIDPASTTWNMTSTPSVTFTAHATGGVPPYSYQWYADGSPLGTGVTQTIYSWSVGTHTVSVVITDMFGRTATAFATLIVVS